MPIPDPQSFSDYISWLGFLFDRWEFVLGLFAGGTVSQTYNHFVTKKKNIMKPSAEAEKAQAVGVADSDGASILTAQGDVVTGISTRVENSPGAIVTVGHPESPSPTHLPERTRWCHDKLFSLLAGSTEGARFSTKYIAGFNFMSKKEVGLAASEYLGAWLILDEKLTNRESYRVGVDQAAQAIFRDSFSKLSVFVSSGQNDIAELTNVINTLELTFAKLEPYLV